ncbi:aminotransferase class I/II-fold pyridoxal phosphate-dependent enzyme [Guyparkeria sp. TX1]|uniref:aminotransferase class I/II-fold pyridoxal phosphate-dependent enzyme n=1 Tax=Guyparkeria sp. TX1 TaxID=3115001 RepID=UPI003977BB5D
MKMLTRDKKNALIERFRSSKAGDQTGGNGAKPRKRHAARARFEDFEAYERIQIQRQASKRLGIGNPFFREHEVRAGGTSRIDGVDCVNFSNYDYLGLNGDPRVTAAAEQAIADYGTSVSASRIVSGERPIHRELERAIADLYQADDALTFVSGHATNVATIGHLFGPRDLVVHDALIHNSALVGAELSGAKRRMFPHNDWEALDRLLSEQRHQVDRVLIVIEGLYSMDGDTPDMARAIEIKKRHGAFLMVDEAHALGVLGDRGRGTWEAQGIDPAEVDIWMGTMSKTLSSCGGYIAGNTALIEMLRYGAPGFVYSVGLAPPLAAAALASLAILRDEPERVARLQTNGRHFLDAAKARGINTGDSEGYCVTPAILGSSIKAANCSNAMLEQGINVQPIIYPAVEERAARLRFFISAEHTKEQIDMALDRLQAWL